MSPEGEKDAAGWSSEGVKIICRVSVTVEDYAVGNGVFFGHALLNLAHAHGCGGEVENDMAAVSRRNAESHGMGADNTLHAAMQSRSAGTDADRPHGYHAC